MQLFVKILIAVTVILLCTQIGRKFPTLGGLIAVMPLTGLIVMVWLYADNPHNNEIMIEYTKGALWGILPTILFFLTAFLCFKRDLSLLVVLSACFGVWIIGAFLHQLFLS